MCVLRFLYKMSCCSHFYGHIMVSETIIDPVNFICKKNATFVLYVRLAMNHWYPRRL